MNSAVLLYRNASGAPDNPDRGLDQKLFEVKMLEPFDGDREIVSPITACNFHHRQIQVRKRLHEMIVPDMARSLTVDDLYPVKDRTIVQVLLVKPRLFDLHKHVATPKARWLIRELRFSHPFEFLLSFKEGVLLAAGGNDPTVVARQDHRASLQKDRSAMEKHVLGPLGPLGRHCCPLLIVADLSAPAKVFALLKTEPPKGYWEFDAEVA